MLGGIYNSIKGGVKKAAGSLSDIFASKPIFYEAPKSEPRQQPQPQYNIPPVIREEHRPMFIEQAKLAGVSPDEFGIIARREQGANTLPHQATVVGLADPTDLGVMQVNKMHDKLIQSRFINELGREYNPNDPVDSMIAARMILEENRRQFEQMKVNNTYSGDYSNLDLIDTYNTGVRGWVDAKKGDREKIKRLDRYQRAGLN